MSAANVCNTLRKIAQFCRRLLRRPRNGRTMQQLRSTHDATADRLRALTGSAQFAARAWTRSSLERQATPIFVHLDERAQQEIRAAVEVLGLRNLHVGIMEPEDFRVPSFGRMVPEIRRRLDEAPGFVVIRGIPVQSLTRGQSECVYWGLANYVGRVMRQNLRGERLDSVRDRGSQISDPYRLIETTKYFLPHTDNGMLEPRWPDYLCLLCLVPAREGGESHLISAYTLLDVLCREHPEYLARLGSAWHIDPPLEQRLPGGPPTWSRPILEVLRGELKIHYLRYYIDPGMQKAGCPLTPLETQMLDYLDRLLQDPELTFAYRLRAGELLIGNNNWTLHGRAQFRDHDEQERKRLLLRIWLWRRHVWPGTDPVDLDAADAAYA